MSVPPPIDIHSDGHVHTRLCNHASGEMEDYVTSAISMGLREIIFLEHMETGIDYTPCAWLSPEDFDYYFREGERLKNIYGDRIDIGLGVEVGYNALQTDRILLKLDARCWDRINISCHYLQYGNDGHLNLLSRRARNHDRARHIGVQRILADYLDSLIEAVQVLPGQVLSHLDAALRHLPEASFVPDHCDRINTLLDHVKKQGMAVEINTSGLNFRKAPFPAPELLSAALTRNIPLVAGSDAHHPADVGRYFDRLEDYISLAVQTSPCQGIRR